MKIKSLPFVFAACVVFLFLLTGSTKVNAQDGYCAPGSVKKFEMNTTNPSAGETISFTVEYNPDRVTEPLYIHIDTPAHMFLGESFMKIKVPINKSGTTTVEATIPTRPHFPPDTHFVAGLFPNGFLTANSTVCIEPVYLQIAGEEIECCALGDTCSTTTKLCDPGITYCDPTFVEYTSVGPVFKLRDDDLCTVKDKSSCQYSFACCAVWTSEMISYKCSDGSYPEIINTDYGGPTCSCTDWPKAKLICKTKGGKQGINSAIGCIPISVNTDFLSFLLLWSMGVAGGFAVLLILYASFIFITSQGDKYKVKAGRELLTAAITGLLFLILSIFFLRIIGVDILGINQLLP